MHNNLVQIDGSDIDCKSTKINTKVSQKMFFTESDYLIIKKNNMWQRDMDNDHSENTASRLSFESLTNRHEEIRKKLHDLWVQQSEIHRVVLKHQHARSVKLK